MPPVLEVPVFSAAAAKVAVEHGATRLEVNRAGSYAAGGLTPTLAEVEAIADAVPVPLRIMIRPRRPQVEQADFLYTDDEFQQMRRELAAFVASGLLQHDRGDGFVFGILKENSTGRLGVDIERNRELVQAARPYACAFHRAFDLVLGDAAAADKRHAESALAAIRECGFSGVLTAGGPGSRGALDHAAMLKELVSTAITAGTNAPCLEIIVGGGVRSSNVRTLAAQVLRGSNKARHAVSFHSSCLVDSAAAILLGAEGEGVSGEEVEQIGRTLASV